MKASASYSPQELFAFLKYFTDKLIKSEWQGYMDIWPVTTASDITKWFQISRAALSSDI